MLYRLPNHNFKVFGPQQKAAQDDSRTRPLAAAPVLSDGRKSGLFLWIHLNDDAESKSVIQTVTELHLLADEICPPITCKSANRLIHGVGFGEAFLRKVVHTALQGCVKNDRFLKVAPKDMVKTFPHVARGSGKTGMPNSGGDIFVHAKSDSRSNLFEFAWLITNEIAPFTKVFDDIYGFTFKDGRDLSGFIDGTENPPENERQEVCIEENTGGSYCITQKWVHDLPFIASQPQNIMESFIGRTMHTDMELNDKAETSHLSRTRAGSEYKGPKPFRIYRQSMPYGKVAGEAGLLFIAFANSTKNFDYQLDRMFGHSPDGLNDDITHFTTCVRSNYWYFPSVEELRRISDNVK